MNEKQLEQTLQKLRVYKVYYNHYKKQHEELYGMNDYNQMEHYKSSIDVGLQTLQSIVSEEEFSEIQRELAEI